MAEVENISQNDLAGLAEGMEATSKARAIEKILGQHNRMAQDIDGLSRTVARQSETIAGLEKRIAGLEAAQTESEPAKSDEGKGRANDSAARRTTETRRRRGWPPF